MGKSTFVQNILSNVAIKENKAILFFCLEESKERIVNKLIISNSRVEADKLGLCAKSSNFKKEKDIGIIIIDYLQLIQFDKSRLLSRDNEITEILKKLEVLSKGLDIPIIVTSQLARKCEKREDKRPRIEDFANSKHGITAYCDKVLFLYRDSYYNKANKNESTEIIVAKSNDGQIGTIKIDWMPEYYTI